MKTSIVLALIGLVGLSASAQTINDSLLIDGNYRSFHYQTPPPATRGGSLIFIMHGSGGNGRDMMKSTGTLDQQATAANAIVVYPDGYKRYWNECRKSSPADANREDVNEQAFFAGMIQYFEKKYRVDPTHVFAGGMSGGGHMAYKLALTMPNQFRAIAAIVANLPDNSNMDCVPTGKPVATMIVNGTLDPINPYNGGAVNLGNNVTMGTVRSTEQTFAYWAGLAGYTGKPTQETLPDTDPNDGRTIERYAYQAANKPDVVLLKVIGGKHDYPHDIDTYHEVLAFFMRQLQPH